MACTSDRKELIKRKETLTDGALTSIAKGEILELERLVEQLRLAKKNSFEEKIKR